MLKFSTKKTSISLDNRHSAFREEYEEEQQKALAIASKKHSALLMSGISKY